MGRRFGVIGWVAAALLLALFSFALPIREWRTGELEVPPLPIVAAGPAVTMPHRVWIDTDAACGVGRTTDPDDCFAVLLLATSPSLELVGISTVHGNAPLTESDSVTRALVQQLGSDGLRAPPVHRGATGPLHPEAAAPPPADSALRAALAAGPLTVVALGPLTNIAAVLARHSDLRANVGRLIAVMGRRPGHLFHPAEGKGRGGILFGHGPVFRDFNFDKDRAAADAVLRMRLPITLMPYDAARELMITAADLEALGRRGGSAAWVAGRAESWLDFWNDEVGLRGFYPFDLLAAAYAVDHRSFDCAPAVARVARDMRLWGRLWGPAAMLVTSAANARTLSNSSPVVYCERPHPSLHARLVATLSRPSSPPH